MRIAEEILDHFFAAQSVVTNALTFLLWDLACHPGWQSKVGRELQSLPAQGDGLPSFADVDAASILDACKGDRAAYILCQADEREEWFLRQKRTIKSLFQPG